MATIDNNKVIDRSRIPVPNPAKECIGSVSQCNYHATGGTDGWCSSKVVSGKDRASI